MRLQGKVAMIFQCCGAMRNINTFGKVPMKFAPLPKVKREGSEVAAKAKKVEGLAGELGGTVSLVVTEYRGLKVGELQELRRRLRPRGIEYHVVKNSLFARAADQSGKGELRSILAGPTAVAIGNGDEVELAKVTPSEPAQGPMGMPPRPPANASMPPPSGPAPAAAKIGGN